MTIQVREYATLTTVEDKSCSIDYGVVSEATFNWLLDLQQRWQQKSCLYTRDGRHHLKLHNYVGYIESPSGEGIEILPKIESTSSNTIENLRALLFNMLKVALGIQGREASAASLMAMKQPIHEWVIEQFLHELADLVKKGLRFDYQTIEENTTFIRGQLDMIRQLRQTPDKLNRFHVRFNEFTPNRLENRILRTCLDLILKLTKSSNNWQSANTLVHQLIDIVPISNPLQQFSKWSDNKQLIEYRKIKPWCKLILEMLNPHYQKGEFRGIAFLFPMEQLFECYVGFYLQKQLSAGFRLTQQANRHFLLKHIPSGDKNEQNWFNLKPDFVIENNYFRFVLDAKWKLLDQLKNSNDYKYGISQSDLYQMFAYGHKYQSGTGNLMLIYPKHDGFTSPLPVFKFDDKMSLWCVPFDLYEKSLVRGNWDSMFPLIDIKF